jgi:hypothetical protein
MQKEECRMQKSEEILCRENFFFIHNSAFCLSQAAPYVVSYRFI